VMLYSEFPRPVPEPAVAVQKTVGRVASISRIDHLFETHDSQGMQATQPIQVVGVSFVPAGMTEEVLAVDLIDDGSVGGLQVGSPATVAYERAATRTARIDGGTRRFPERNLKGAILSAVLFAGGILLIFAMIVLGGRLMGSLFRNVLQRR
jgi:hypothetical protein